MRVIIPDRMTISFYVSGATFINQKMEAPFSKNKEPYDHMNFIITYYWPELPVLGRNTEVLRCIVIGYLDLPN